MAARYSTLDLNAGEITGGEQHAWTLGANWYINEQLRLMANYLILDNDSEADDAGNVNGNDDPQILQLRLQVAF